MSVGDDSRIVHQVLGDDTVQDEQDEEGDQEEYSDAADEEEHPPERVHCGQAHKHVSAVHVLLLAIGRDGEHRTGRDVNGDRLARGESQYLEMSGWVHKYRNNIVGDCGKVKIDRMGYLQDLLELFTGCNTSSLLL